MKEPKLIPANVVGVLRAKCRQYVATIAALEAKNQGQAVEIEQLRAALEGRRSAGTVEHPREG